MRSARPLEMCLVVVTREQDGGREVLLGQKRRGFGHGRVVVPGGKIDAGESPEDTAARELREETGLVASHLQPCGVLDFAFPHHPGTRDMRAHVFTTSSVQGRVTDSDEIAARWVRLDAVPYDAMWPDARHWLPLALRDELRHASFVYGPDGVTLDDARL